MVALGVGAIELIGPLDVNPHKAFQLQLMVF